MSNLWKLGVAAVVAVVGVGGSAASAEAAAITCQPSNQRVATLGDAIECRTANDINLNDSGDLNDLFGDSYNYIKEGELTGAGTNDLFKVTADSWGSDVTGQWFIDPSFWNLYNRAIITMHVGHGGGNPDAFAWLITPGETQGNFTYEKIEGGGGGLSNMFLFGVKTPTTTTTTSTPSTTGTPTTGNVPEPTVGLLSAIGLLSVVGVRLWTRKPNA